MGIDIDIELMISIVLVFPMMTALNEAYKKALELRNIDISELNRERADGAVMIDSNLQQLKATATAPPMRRATTTLRTAAPTTAARWTTRR